MEWNPSPRQGAGRDEMGLKPKGPGFCHAVPFLSTSAGVDFSPVQVRPGFESPWAMETFQSNLIGEVGS
jgi:hypothetical protein